jgi:hypothetical protein
MEITRSARKIDNLPEIDRHDTRANLNLMRYMRQRLAERQRVPKTGAINTRITALFDFLGEF